MNTIAIGELRKMGGERIKKILPVIITFDGEPVAIMATLKGVVVLSDLHPRMQAKMKNMELRARAGMLKPEKVVAADILIES